MKINKLVLQNFKKFSYRTIEFGEGFNVVIGENESGKSTIVEALLLILYANPSSKSKDLEKFYSWKSDRPFRLELEFEISGEKVTLIKDFSKREGVLKLPDGKEITNPDLIQEYLYSNLNIPLKSIYLNSAFIKQDEIINLDYDGDFRNSIQNMVIEGEDEVDISNIIKGLDKNISLLTKGIKGNSNNPGPIKTLTEKIDKNEIEIRTMEDKWTLSLKSRETVEGNNSEINRLTEKIEIDTGFLKKVSTSKELTKTVNEYNKRYDELVEVEDAFKENELLIKSLEHTIDEDYKVYSELNDVPKIEEDINTLIAQEEVLSRVEPTGTKNIPMAKNLNIALITGVLLIGGVLSIILKDIIPFIISLAGVGLYLIINKIQQADGAKPLKPSQNEDLIIETKKKLEVYCQKFGLDDVKNILIEISKYKKLNIQIRELELKKKFILGKYTLEKIEQDKKIALKEITKIDIQIKESKFESGNYSDEKLHQLEYNIEKDQAKLKILERETMLSQAMLASSDISQEGINIKKEQLEEDKSELQNNKDQLIVFQLVKESIEKSCNQTINDSKIAIEKLINTNISKLTNGRYSEVKLSPELNMEVFSKEKGEHISCGNLSKGTIDQIFLLARLGYAQGLLGTNKMPIILDDPFVNFDEKRLLNIKEIFIRMSLDYQMILFTHNQNYAKWGRLLSLE